MDFKAFLEQILTAVNEELPAGRKAAYKTVNKMNGVSYTGICLEPGEKGTVSPIVYMEPIFESIRSEEAVPGVVQELLRVLMTPVQHETMADQVMNFGFSSARIVFRLMRLSDNEILLKNLPYREFLDMAVTYAVLFSGEGQQFGIAQVTDELLRKWATDEETLHRLAVKNTPELLGETVKTLNEVIGDRGDQNTAEGRKKSEEADRFFLVGNEYGFLGASALLYPERFAPIAEKVGSDLYLLPTSVHEVMTVPVDERPADELKELQKLIADDEPKREHLLTDSVYYYSRETGTITKA